MKDYWNQTPILRAVIWMMLFEAFWLGYYGQQFYEPVLDSLNPPTFKLRLQIAILAYICMAISFHYIIIPLTKNMENPVEVIQVGGIMGLIVYGTYNFTNHAILEAWDLKVSMIDLTWGILLYSAVTFLTKYAIF